MPSVCAILENMILTKRTEGLVARRKGSMRENLAVLLAVCAGVLLCVAIAGCGEGAAQQAEEGQAPEVVYDRTADEASARGESVESEAQERNALLESLRSDLGIQEDFRSEFDHGEKGAKHQKYIMLHDTEIDASPADIVSSWDSADAGVAAHFVVGKDGSVVQCVPMDAIAHHAGFGDAGHNDSFGVIDESRDDKVGTTPIGDWAPDYGMNSYSVGIEMVHVGGSGGYPAAQLKAVDGLIAYIDAYYGSESEIIDHKAWRTGNSDTNPEFAEYLACYQEHRVHSV